MVRVHINTSLTSQDVTVTVLMIRKLLRLRNSPVFSVVDPSVITEAAEGLLHK